MIKIKDAEKPDYLSSPIVKASKKDIRKQVEKGIQSLNIPSHWGDVRVGNTIKDVLFSMHHKGKCCYCERKRTRKREMDVEHYRPKAKVTEDPDHKGYWWLAYSWDNYLWSCKSCNEEYKKNHFPLHPTGVRAKIKTDDLALENPYLINPRFDEPTEYLAYYKKNLGGRWFVKIIPLPDLDRDKKQRAENTIKILGLNRIEEGDDLVSERGESFNSNFENIAYGLKTCENALTITPVPEAGVFYTRQIIEFRKQLKDYVCAEKEFSGFFRYFLTDIGINYSDLI